jgi:hypothetical protein
VLGLAATFLASGCDTGDDIGDGSPSPSASASGSATTSTAAEPEQTPDQALVDEVDARLAAALAVLLQSRKAPGLARALRPLIQAHRRHVAVLEGDAGPTAPPGPAQQPGPALKAVVGSERGLRDALVDAAGRAESGALAKLLASMAASTAQHLAALPKKAR